MVTRTTGKRQVVKNTFSQGLIDTVFDREVNLNCSVYRHVHIEKEKNFSNKTSQSVFQQVLSDSA